MAKIVSIHSFRGGTGKSNITANLATLLYCQGQRVGIIDTDIQSPGVHVLFGFQEESLDKTLNDYLWGYCDIEKTAYDMSHQLKPQLGKFVNQTGAIYLIPSSIKAEEITQILTEGYDVELLKTGLDQLIEALNLDYLLIDTHPGLNEETLISIGLSDMTLVIMRPDHQDYQGTAVTVEICKELLEGAQIWLVVNKVLPDFDFDALTQQLETTYQVPVAGILPESQDMLRIASHSLFCLSYPDSQLTEALQGVVKKLRDS